MDRGHFFEKTYKFDTWRCQELDTQYCSINDIQVQSNAIFSECRYLAHWAWSIEPDGIQWPCIALTRLEELSSR